MSRTNANAVRDLLGNQYDGSSSLIPFIDTASVIVTRVVACATKKSVTLSTEEQELIERYLAAHFYGNKDQFYSSKSTAGASASFMGQTGMRLDGSNYGQTAQTLDPSGCLAALSKGAKASIMWLGKNKLDRIDAEDR